MKNAPQSASISVRSSRLGGGPSGPVRRRSDDDSRSASHDFLRGGASPRPATSSPTLSIVIPAYNESARICSTLHATRAYLERRGLTAEVIVVDDGSSDRTAALVREIVRVDSRVKLLELGCNRGKGAAVREGVLASRGERILFMDADLATPLSELASLSAALDAGFDVAVGSRALPESKITVRQSKVRSTMGRCFNVMVQVIAVGGVRDTQCGFKLFTRSAAHTLFRETRIDRFAFDVEVLLLCQGRFDVAEVPVAWRHVDESKVSPFTDAAQMAFDLVKLRLGVTARGLAQGWSSRLRARSLSPAE